MVGIYPLCGVSSLPTAVRAHLQRSYCLDADSSHSQPCEWAWMHGRPVSHVCEGPLLLPRLQGNYIMFHHVKGTPYDTADQGAVRRLTHWEQIDNGEQFTTTRKFLTAVPVIL